MKKSVMLLILLALAIGSDQSFALQGNGTGGASEISPAEAAKGEAVPEGFANLLITGSFKTHHPGIYSSQDPHGTHKYQLQLSIDGQSVLTEVELQAEKLSIAGPSDPEAGDGVRYRIRKAVSLPAGVHRVVASLPADKISIDKEVLLQEGVENRLVLDPVYGRVLAKKRPSANRATSFKEGISRMVMTFNGRRI